MTQELNARQLARRRRAMQRQQYLDRVTAPDRTPLQGTVLGYDAEAAAYRIQVAGGRVIRAASLSNGAIPTGDRVRINTARGSVLPTVDGMPR